MRQALLSLLLVSVAGCTGVDVPCLPWDDGCAMAALTAEGHLGADDWDAGAVVSIGCEEAAANRGGFVPDRCWLVDLKENAEDPASATAHVVLTTDGDLVLMGEPTVTDR